MIFEMILHVLRMMATPENKQQLLHQYIYTVLEALNNNNSDSDYQLQDTDSDSNINAVECASEEHLGTSNESNPCVLFFCRKHIYLVLS